MRTDEDRSRPEGEANTDALPDGEVGGVRCQRAKAAAGRAKPPAPSFLRGGVTIEVSLAEPGEASAAFQLVASKHEKGILFRNRREFRKACREGRVYVARWRERDRLLVAVVLFVPQAPSGTAGSREEEVASLLVDERMRGFGIASWLLRFAIVHRIASVDYDLRTPRTWMAKVLDGNTGPHRALLDAGFRRDDRIVELDPARFGGTIDHMLAEGASTVPAYRYHFDLSGLDRVICALHTFIEAGAAVERGGAVVKFAFDPSAVSPEALKFHVAWLEARGWSTAAE